MSAHFCRPSDLSEYTQGSDENYHHMPLMAFKQSQSQFIEDWFDT
eukprot:CAMPEP_0205808184 /NCGR_PEP_ID=MMETSP0205-20121125/12063_1 /ASSEMBLY_ACC=CAM_ASM_000278 /TAXON_ID=36767 /ORGANISM="Euplotes focardii, Strain TN1" /LENGTH=44 /DNA_ID= /DNA_START= /DNA_END= /DNA_ORIENTATION=